MYIDKTMVEDNIALAYDIFAGMGLEKQILIEDYNITTGVKEADHTVLGLWLNKDTIKVGKDTQFLTEARPSVYVRRDKLVDKYGNPLDPDHSWRISLYVKPPRKEKV